IAHSAAGDISGSGPPESDREPATASFLCTAQHADASDCFTDATSAVPLLSQLIAESLVTALPSELRRGTSLAGGRREHYYTPADGDRHPWPPRAKTHSPCRRIPRHNPSLPRRCCASWWPTCDRTARSCARNGRGASRGRSCSPR